MMDFGVKHMGTPPRCLLLPCPCTLAIGAGAAGRHLGECCPFPAGSVPLTWPVWLRPSHRACPGCWLQAWIFAKWKSWDLLLNECPRSSHPPCKQVAPLALVEGWLGDSCGLGLCARLGLGWRWSISSSFWCPSRSPWLSLPSITWQILLTGLQELQVRNCYLMPRAQPWGNWGVGGGAWAAVGSCHHPLKRCVGWELLL